jgi:acyl-CoA synthetase (AMP-forming)/AMP-acid ligase II
VTEDSTRSGELYNLTTGKALTSLSPFASPLEEYQAAFEERDHPFVHYYTFNEGQTAKRSLNRGEFWDLAQEAAAHLKRAGIGPGNRVVHFFNANSLHDLVFRLAAVLVGCVPVTINWQADDNERIAYKTAVTDARLLIHSANLAEWVAELKPLLGNISLLEAEVIERSKLARAVTPAKVDWNDERIIVFTSGTTARPRGAVLPHRSFLADRLIFEDYFGMSPEAGLDLVIVNPLHHVNSSVLCDWGLRRSRVVIHLLERYTTPYWEILSEAAAQKRHRLVTALVARHIDFLKSLADESRLPTSEAKIKNALCQTDILIGSAPVGPKTVASILRFGGQLPHVRFGATETCLETMATPTTLSHDELMAAFEAGWQHRYQGEEAAGYYIGREHFPFTRLRVVKAIDPENSGYLKDCALGEPGYLITQGANLMSGYVGDPEATAAVFREGWYTGLKDIVFTLRNRSDGKLDYYWMSRDSELLIRGGANYAYTQVAAELSRFVEEGYHLEPGHFQLAVIGLRVESEHEDSCGVTIELNQETGPSRTELEKSFLERASATVNKGCRPDYLRLAPIPRSFKGAVLYPQLKRDYLDSLKKGTALRRRPPA